MLFSISIIEYWFIAERAKNYFDLIEWFSRKWNLAW